MRRLLLIGAVLLAFGSVAHGQAYRCETEEGTVFSDEPCGDNAEAIELEQAPTTETAKPTRRESGTGDERSGANPSSEDSDDAASTASGAPDNPCLDPSNDNKILSAGTAESDIRSACGEPDKVTDSGNAAFDKTLHYSEGDRGMQIFILDGAKVGHNLR